MAMQQQQSSLAKRLGGKLAEANAECAGKPLVLGQQKLPGGIKNGIALVERMQWKEQDKDDGKVPRGQLYFFGRAITMFPVEFGGMRTAGTPTIINIPLCDIVAKGLRKASSFKENWDKFRSLIEAFGVAPCPETRQSDPTGVKTEAYFLAAMQTLTNVHKPTYVHFTTNAIPGNKTPQNPNPEPFIYEQWFGTADMSVLNMGNTSGVNLLTNGASQPDPTDSPPSDERLQTGDGLPTNNQIHEPEPDSEPLTIEEEVEQLIDAASEDPTGATEEGAAASARLQELAWANGWSEEDTANAEDWEQVGKMALTTPEDTANIEPQNEKVTIGSKWKFCKRDKAGEKLKNAKKEELPSFEVEVVTIDTANNTCTIKSVKDGKDVISMQTKKPLVVKFEWLE